MRACLLLLACISAAACGGAAEAPRQVRAVLLVTIDRLPRDAFGDTRRMPRDAFSDTRRMPRVRARARGADWHHGELFANAESSAGALASLLTASAPERHGLRAAGAPDEHGLDTLAPPTLAGRLTGNGWTCAAFLPLPWLGREFCGLGAEFDRESAPPAERGATWTPAADLVPPVLEELARRAESGRPFFVWIHLADARAELAARSPHLAAALTTRLAPFAEALPGVATALELAHSDAAAALRELRATVGRRRGSPEQAALDAALLDAGLADVDAAVDAIVAALERDPRWGDTLICLAGTGGPGRGLVPTRLATTFALRLPHGLRLGAGERDLPLAQLELGGELAALVLNSREAGQAEAGGGARDEPTGLAALTATSARVGGAAWLEHDSAGTLRLVVQGGLEHAAVHAWPGGGVLPGAELPDASVRLRHAAGSRVTIELAGNAGPLDVQIESPLGELLAIELENGGDEGRSRRTSERAGSGQLSGAGTLVVYTARALPGLALGLALGGRAPLAGEVACDGVALETSPRPVLLRRRGEAWQDNTESPWTVDVQCVSARSDWRVRVDAAPGTSVELLARVWPPGPKAGLELAPTQPMSGGTIRSEHQGGRPGHLRLSGSGPMDVLLRLAGARTELVLIAVVDGRRISAAEIRFRGAHPNTERLTLALDARAWQKRGPSGPRAETPIRIEWTALVAGRPVPRAGPRALGPTARELLPSLPQDD